MRLRHEIDVVQKDPIIKMQLVDSGQLVDELVESLRGQRREALARCETATSQEEYVEHVNALQGRIVQLEEQLQQNLQAMSSLVNEDSGRRAQEAELRWGFLCAKALRHTG